MATTAEKRAWLRDNGYNPNVKGALSGEQEAIYDAAHPAPNGDVPGDEWFPDPDESLTGEAGPPPEDRETPPRRPPRTPPKRGWPWDRKGRRTGPRRKHVRMPVDEVISGGWRLMARLARPVPPLERTLKVQSPVAGLLLEDVVKGTVVDVILQPLARFQRQGKAVAALAGPPLLVTAGSLHMQRQLQAGLEPSPVFMGFIHEALRESLMLWMDVAGPKFEEALKREREFEEHYGHDVDEFITWLFSPPVNPADEASVRAEEDAIRRAQGILKE